MQNSIPLFLQRTVEDLQNLSDVSVELLTHSQHDGWTVPISVLADDDGEISPQLMLPCANNEQRMRKAAVFAFKRDGACLRGHHQAEPPHTKIYTTTGQDQDEVWATLRCAAIDFTKGVSNDTLDSPLQN